MEIPQRMKAINAGVAKYMPDQVGYGDIRRNVLKNPFLTPAKE